MIKTLGHNHGLFVIRYHKVIEQSDVIINDINKYEVLLKLNNKNVITYGKNTLKFYNYIQKNNLNYGLISVNNLLDIDLNVLKDLEESSTLIVYDEVIKTGSLGEKLLNNEIIRTKNIKVKHYSLPNGYLVNGTEEEILKYYNLNIANILKEEE